MSLSSFSMIRRSSENAERCREILQLSADIEWSDLKVEFGLDEPGLVTLVLIPTGEQIRDLAELAIQQLHDSCAAPDTPLTAG